MPLSISDQRRLADVVRKSDRIASPPFFPGSGSGFGEKRPDDDWNIFRIKAAMVNNAEVEALRAWWNGSAWTEDTDSAETRVKIRGWFLPAGTLPNGTYGICYRHGGVWWLVTPSVCPS